MILSKMADLESLVAQDIPDGRNSLQESHVNLDRVAEYCETKYFQVENKRAALEETKNFTTQSLASVAYQINTLAYNFLQMLDMQTSQLADMESNINHIAQMIMIHKEKVARREIGVLTTNKNTTRQHRIIAPANQERPIKYIRKPIDYTALDEVGHGVKTTNNTPRSKQRIGSGSSNSGSAIGLVGSGGGNALVGQMIQMSSSSVSAMTLNGSQSGPPPTTKPPTPPQAIRQTGTLSKGSRDYRTLAPPVAPPQVPSNYAPNYPVGHPRAMESRRGDRGSGYGTLPNVTHSVGGGGAPPQPSVMSTSGQPPQVGMVHPMVLQQAHGQHHHHVGGPSSPVPPPPLDMAPSHPHGYNMHSAPPPPPTPPPPPMTMAMGMMGGHRGDFDRLGNASPPLPPPPEDDHALFMSSYTPPTPLTYGRHTGVNAPPSWVPPTYLEKVIAIYDYMADKDDELSFSENSVIYVIKKNDDGWYEGVMDGVTGLFPGNYVEPCM